MVNISLVQTVVLIRTVLESKFSVLRWDREEGKGDVKGIEVYRVCTNSS